MLLIVKRDICYSVVVIADGSMDVMMRLVRSMQREPTVVGKHCTHSSSPFEL